MRFINRLILFIALFALSFSPVTSAMAFSSHGDQLLFHKPVKTVPDRLLSPENPDEKVRIIVELENEPTIEKATERGVLYKELGATERQRIEKVVEGEQKTIQGKIKEEAPSIDYLNNFTTVFNGFSAEVEAEYVEKIANMPGVKAVYEATEYHRPAEKPEMIYSKELVQAQQAWNNYSFKGEGMVVGVIDTGIDPTHKDMVLTDEITGEITESEVEALFAAEKIEAGMYYSAKVPFAYNYMDDNNLIMDIGPEASMHGMHVAGIVGANGNEDDGGIKGIAPEAQILGLKVFGNDPLFPSTFGDIYIEAIDDAIQLGADVINMSLGSTAGFVDSSHPEQQAVKRAVDNGVLVAISAGNSAMFGDGYFFPYAENQDYGLTGSPSVSHESLSVASFENSTITAYSYKYAFDGTEYGRALYLLANNADPVSGFKGPMEIVDAGLGYPEDFEGKDFKGKIALIKRGEFAFVDKGLNAQAAGAAGVIIYNHVEGTVNMVTDSTIKIPYMFSLKVDGDAMKAALDAGQKVTVEFDGEYLNIPSPDEGLMSEFTSWGPTPNLDFKPEITAPGGNIFSTLNDNQYGIMSGTSMAAPHVAGGAALVFERVNTEFGLTDLTSAERVQLAKNLLMNTAKPVEFSEGEFVSPRRQGAGLMQLANALNTDVVVTNKETGEAKVTLKEINGNLATFTLEAKNYSNVEKTYNVEVAVQVDDVATVEGHIVTVPNQIGSKVVTEEVQIEAEDSITIPGGGIATVTVSIDLSNLGYLREVFTNGYFVDGFVTFSDANEESTGNVPLSVPFFGFNGGWDDAPLFDYFAWEDKTQWGATALADENKDFIMTDETFILNQFGFSPNGDGKRDKVIPVFSLMRNAKEFKVEVTDDVGKTLRTIRTTKELRKHYSNTADSPPYSYSLNYAWDGQINNKTAPDGQYRIKISGVIDYEGAEWQSLSYPVKVDTKAPTATAIFDSETKTVSLLNSSDGNGTGADYWRVLINGDPVPEDEVLDIDTTHYVIDQELGETDVVEIEVIDVARNPGVYKVIDKDETEKEKPVIVITDPAGDLSYHNNGDITISGTVEDNSDIVSLTVNGEEISMENLPNFSHHLNLEEGTHDVTIRATDIFGNTGEITKTVIVDIIAPEISFVKYNHENRTIHLRLQDNFDVAHLSVNDVTVEDIKLNEDIEIPLKEGAKEFTFIVKDIAGNTTSRTIYLNEGKAMFLSPEHSKMELNVHEEKILNVFLKEITSEGVTDSGAITKEAIYSYDESIIEIINDEINSDVKVKALAEGSTIVEVAYSDMNTNFTVTVKKVDQPEPERRLDIGQDFTIVDGETKTLQANLILIDENGNQLESTDVTDEVTFASDNEAVVVMNGKTLSAVGQGTAKIIATYRELTDELIVTVQPRPPVPDPPAPPPTPPGPPAPPPPPSGDEAVDEQLKDPNATEVKVEAPAPSASQPTVKAELSSQSIQALADSGKPLVVKAGNIEVGVPASLIKGMGLAANEKAEFQIALVEDANVNTSGNLASDVFDFSISIVGYGGSRAVSNFEEPVSVTMPLKTYPADPRKVSVYHVNEETGELEYSGGKYSDGALNFKTRHFSKFVAVEYNKTFADIHLHWAKDEIEVLASRMITTGTTEKTFSPDDEVTRAQFAVLLSRALTLPKQKFEGVFKDIPENMTWGNIEIEAAYRAGIIKGKTEGVFEPNTPITREQMTLMMIRAIEYQNPSMLKELKSVKTFTDIGGVNPVTQKSIMDATSLGLLKGYYDGTFRPRDYSTRAQTSVVLYRLLKQLGEL